MRIVCDECGDDCAEAGIGFYFVDGQHFCEDCWTDNPGRHHMEDYWESQQEYQTLKK